MNTFEQRQRQLKAAITADHQFHPNEWTSFRESHYDSLPGLRDHPGRGIGGRTNQLLDIDRQPVGHVGKVPEFRLQRRFPLWLRNRYARCFPRLPKVTIVFYSMSESFTLTGLLTPFWLIEVWLATREVAVCRPTDFILATKAAILILASGEDKRQRRVTKRASSATMFAEVHCKLVESAGRGLVTGRSGTLPPSSPNADDETTVKDVFTGTLLAEGDQTMDSPVSVARLEGHDSVGSQRLSLEGAEDHHPWWVRKVARPKYELDEAVYSRFDPRHHAFALAERKQGFGQNGGSARVGGRGSGIRRGFYAVTPFKGRPGWELRDRALAEGANTIRYSVAKELYAWHRLQAHTPEDFGVERHQGSPAENSRLVKLAARFYGAVEVGVALLDRRHVYSVDERGKPIVFDDVDQPIVAEDRWVIPKSCQWVIAVAVAQSEEAIARAPDGIASAAVAWGYSMMPVVAGSLAEFIRSLGYVAIPSGNDLALSVPIAVDAGLGEMSRLGLLITPKLGPRVRLANVITDLPLQPDSPIDFGAREFCETCKKCARLCPSRSLSFEREASYNVLGEWNNPGHKGWYFNAPTCLDYWGKVHSGCSTCVRVCPYGKRDTWWHRAAMATISSTRIFNKLIASGDDWMGFGKRRHPDRFWAGTPAPFGLD